jgi:hypothetical protein
MKRDNERLVKDVVSLQESMNSLSIDAVNERAPLPEEQEIPPSLKQKALKEGAIWLEPKVKLQGFGKLKAEWKKHHAHDWEYVCGIFQPENIAGRPSMEPKTFWFCKWAGDPDCLWEVPVNRKVYLPRMVALHLSGERDPLTGMEAMKYHSFDYLQSPETYWRPDQFTHQFGPTGTHYRGRFVPIGVFA